MQTTRTTRFLTVFGLTAALIGTWMMGRSYGESQAMKKVIHASSASATYKEVIKGVSKAPAWGDGDMGAYGAFTKFAPGIDNGTHTHSSDVWIVVLKGAYLFKDDSGEKRVGPGDFIRIPANHKHWSGGDANEGALFYEESSGKFDLHPAK